MKRQLLLLFVLGLIGVGQIGSLVAQYSEKSHPQVLAYIERFQALAIEEMQQTGIPASIKLAQGIYESGAGTSRLAKEGNNHFGIKCKTEWTGKTITHTDDRRNECFRRYESAEDSYRDHSQFLRTRPHYAFLFELDPADYKAWARGLKQAGYATSVKYPEAIIRLIETYKLDRFDRIGPDSSGTAERSTN